VSRARRPGDGVGKPAPSTLSLPEQLTLAHEAALRLLDHRERSAAELRLRLKEKGFGPEAITREIARLQETGLQDDGRFAERFAADAGRRGLAARRIQGELQRRGIDRELAATASAEDPDDEESRARELASTRGARMSGLPPDVRYRRLLGLLARRGFEPEVCRKVAREMAETGSLDRPTERELP
jgi:regulatory protein